MPALIHQPTWSRAYARLANVEPLLSMALAERTAFTDAITTARSADELSAEHLRVLREGEKNFASGLTSARERGGR